MEAGYHEIDFDVGNIQSGVYLYKILSGDFIQTKKMIFLKKILNRYSKEPARILLRRIN